MAIRPRVSQMRNGDGYGTTMEENGKICGSIQITAPWILVDIYTRWKLHINLPDVITYWSSKNHVKLAVRQCSSEFVDDDIDCSL